MTGGDSELSPRLHQVSELQVSTDPIRGTEELVAASGELGVAESGPGSLQLDADGRVAVTVRYSAGPDDADVAALAALGVVHAASARFGQASASVAPADLDAVAALPNVTTVVEALAPAVGRSAFTDGASASVISAATAAAPAESCRTVPVNLAAPLGAAVAAHDFGVDGSGVTVGVISDSFDRDPSALTTPDDDVAAGVLPGPGNPCGFETPVEVVHEASADATDEGRAMAQLVHGIAPGARILFASAGQDDLTFATAIADLADAGADVIVDDITMLSDPFFQDGPIGVSIRDVERHGVAYLAAAGNFTALGATGYPSAGLPISSWATEAYRPAPCPTDVLTELAAQDVASADCMDFDPGEGVDATDGIVFSATPDGAAVTFALQWAEPFGAAQGTFRFALVRPDGGVDLGPANASGLPTVIGATGTVEGAYDFVIVRDTSLGASALVTPAMKLLLARADPFLRAVEHSSSKGGDVVGPTITGHAGAPQTIAVAASPYDSPLAVEYYSSGGPTTTYFRYDPDVSPVATPLPEPIVTSKPDVTGVDGGFTTFFGSSVGPGVYAFYGTSAASPAVAAVVALGRELRPEASLETVRTALSQTAVPLASPLPSVFEPRNIVGAGLVDSERFLAALKASAPVPAPQPDPVPAPAAVAAPPQLAATGSAPEILPLTILALLLAAAGGSLILTRHIRSRGV
ncbi:S8 family serine peptidase [Herbiconiux sp. UC225_62]|uniref:S8 family serine peptidase n=1 Tax=Herbiconiux sp. UC225_62 TaxID=3350168 RepID=UPI0036D39F52